MKYIIVEAELGLETPVIFPESIQHQQIGNRQNVISAGFCTITQGVDWIKVSCYGKSDSLRKVSRPEIDSKLLEEFINGRL